MESSRSKRRRLMTVSSYISPRRRPDLPAIFESLNDDTLTTILEFVGDKSYAVYAMINKHCKEVYLNTPGMTKETFLYGYAPLSVIQNRYDSDTSVEAQWALSKGVVLYNRRDVMEWALEKQSRKLSEAICNLAAREGRIDILNKVLNNVDNEDDKDYIFLNLDELAAQNGKLDVLKWFEKKGFHIYKDWYKEDRAREASEYGHLHILKWLRDERGLELDGYLYGEAIDGDQLHVMKWLREQEVDWDIRTFYDAAEEGNLDILQWLHDEGCPWSDDPMYRVYEYTLKPEVVDWCRVSGYGGRIIVD